MKHLPHFLCFATALISSATAFADWEPVGHSAQAHLLIDAKTIKIAGGKAKVWVLANFVSPARIENTVSNSSKTFFEYDCKEVRSRVLTTYFYSEKDSKGNVNAAEFDVMPWVPVAPETISMSVLKRICPKQ